MAFGRDKFGRFVHRINTAKIPSPQQFRRFGERAGRTGARITQRGVSAASRHAIGLSPREFVEFQRLEEMRRQGIITGEEAYLLESKRLKELKGRYKGPQRKEQFKRFLKRLHEGPPKRLRA
jgi:hypothetical protein